MSPHSESRAWWREPLVHFVALAALIFALERAVGAPAATAPDGEREVPREIVVDDGARRELADAYLHQHGAPPDEATLRALVSAWIDEEVLYREGLARGLDRGDPRVRARVASAMGRIVEAQLPVAAPTDDELRAYFAEHAPRWAEDERVDFVHVFVSVDEASGDAAAEARAAELLAQLEAGASPSGLGDTFSGGRRYRGRRIEDLAQAFGPQFVVGMREQPIGSWARRRSRHGLHLVRIESRSAATAADFERSRLDVEREWRLSRTEARMREALDELRAR